MSSLIAFLPSFLSSWVLGINKKIKINKYNLITLRILDNQVKPTKCSKKHSSIKYHPMPSALKHCSKRKYVLQKVKLLSMLTLEISSTQYSKERKG
jgi:hypothetical protein